MGVDQNGSGSSKSAMAVRVSSALFTWLNLLLAAGLLLPLLRTSKVWRVKNQESPPSHRANF